MRTQSYIPPSYAGAVQTNVPFLRSVPASLFREAPFRRKCSMHSFHTSKS